MDSAVIEYRKRRQKRLDARFDDEEEEGNNQPQKKAGGGSHGNTRLPFGLCQRYGIEVGRDWTPRDAWDALAGKGITPSEEYGKLGGGTFKSRFGGVYSNIFSKNVDGKYYLYGDYDEHIPGHEKKTVRKSMYSSFLNKEEMYAFLQENGVKKFKDPDTGETVNPMKMDLPKTVAKIGETRYQDIVIGARASKSGRPYDTRGITVVGKDFTGKKSTLKTFDTPKEAYDYIKKIGCSDEDLRYSKDFKKYYKPSVKPDI